MKVNSGRFLMFVLAILLITGFGCSGPEEKKQAFFEKGNQLFAQKEFEKARLEYKNAIQIDSEFAQAYVQLGKTELKLKNYQKVLGAFAKAVELDPDNMEARINLGKILLAGKAIDRAEKQADAVLEKDSSHAQAALLKASVHFAGKAYDKGRDILLKIYAKGGAPAEVFVMLAAVARLNGDEPKQRIYLEQGLEKYPDHLPLILSLARLEAVAGNYNAFEKHLQKAVDLKPGDMSYTINLAKAYVARDKKQAAEKILDQAIARDEQNEARRIKAADFWLSAKAVEKAEDLIKQGIEITPDSFDYRLFLGDLYAKTRQMDKAEEILRNALDLNPDPANPDIITTRLALAKLLMLTRRVQEAEKIVDTVIENDLKNVEAHFIKGKIYLSRNDGANAVPEFRILVEEKPEVVQGHLNLAQAHVMIKEYDLALEVLKNAYKAMPEKTSLLRSMARINAFQGDKKAAEANLEKAVQANPELLEPLADLGDFYASSKLYDNALKQYGKIIDKKPDTAVGYLKGASVYMRTERPDKAVDILKTGYAHNPDSARIVSSLVRAYIQIKEYASAEKICRTRLEKNDKETFTWMLLGSIHEKSRAYKKAADTYKQAFEKNPELWAAANNFAFVQSRTAESKSDLNLAMEYAEKARALAPEAGVVQDTIGWIHYHLKNLDKAYSHVQKAVEKHPDNPDMNFHMAMILNAQGKTRKAKSYFETALASDKEFDDAQTARKMLNKN